MSNINITSTIDYTVKTDPVIALPNGIKIDFSDVVGPDGSVDVATVMPIIRQAGDLLGMIKFVQPNKCSKAILR
jgi:hypothetical protein